MNEPTQISFELFACVFAGLLALAFVFGYWIGRRANPRGYTQGFEDGQVVGKIAAREALAAMRETR